MGSSLRSFIKDVRGAKTLADERAIITKQSAKIRTKLRDDHLPHEKRRVNIQKLLYLYILGEKTHFGQVECINLIASDDFVDKRLGYLAATLLLDESEDLLTLLTNMLNNDLHHPNKYAVSLALTSLGFLSSPELARDLYPDVENIIKNSKDPFLLKKALQCAAKLIFKDVSLLEIFNIEDITKILANHSVCTHGVLLGVAKILQSILSIGLNRGNDDGEDGVDYNSDVLSPLSLLLRDFFVRLENLNSKNIEPGYDVQGICDPFLQCEMIYTLKLYFQVGELLDSKHVLDYKNNFCDLLTRIATNTDSTKNSGQAILYETVKTIFSLNLNQPLRVLGVNILAKFLTGKENNTKYVSLNTLLNVVPQEPTAVQRHRKFISHCLQDSDVSIRMRALELSFAILDDSNLVDSVNELMKFLAKQDEDSKDLIVYSIDHLVDTFDFHTVKDEGWKLDIFLNVLKMVGSFINYEKINDILIIINNTTQLSDKSDFLRKLLTISLGEKSIEITDENIGWQLVLIWCIGEYGDLILNQNDESSTNIINESSVTNYLLNIKESYTTTNHKIFNYILTAALKLSIKVHDPKNIEQLRQLILGYSDSSDLLLQTKCNQYEIFFNQPVSVRKVILETMPKFEKINEKQNNIKKPSKSLISDESTNLISDLLGDDSKTEAKTLKSDNVQPIDLLEEIFGEKKAVNQSVKSGEEQEKSADLPLQSTKNSNVILPSDAVKIHDSTSLNVYASLLSANAGQAHIELYFQAKLPMSDLQTFCAVPKTQKLTLGQLHPSSTIEVNQICKQLLKISGSGKLKLRVKLNFHLNGSLSTTNEQFDHKFDKTL
ncbi:apl4p [Saccharomyces arboricola H-6]|uniref:AP-1 complex subunit gamma n=1 Tax=Saccharomyces arboricola (strain H-6 / AS 2.3317 / CBS 10644) TaxID=1160507 RepID=J8LH07_SACAR|nr:apl4p [Saccharomyces arboricola H-6]